MDRAIYFDMDGTLADLYGVPEWLPRLRAYDVTPYRDARPLINMKEFAFILKKLQNKGYKIGINSWVSKVTTPEYTRKTRAQKIRWLYKHLNSVEWDEIHITQYGRPKHLVARCKNSILFDDKDEIRSSWAKDGKRIAYDEKNIIENLKKILESE